MGARAANGPSIFFLPENSFLFSLPSSKGVNKKNWDDSRGEGVYKCQGLVKTNFPLFLTWLLRKLSFLIPAVGFDPERLFNYYSQSFCSDYILWVCKRVKETKVLCNNKSNYCVVINWIWEQKRNIQNLHLECCFLWIRNLDCRKKWREGRKCI